MLGRIIFCVVLAAAVLAVVLLATVSPLPRRSTGHHKAPAGLRALTVYIHPAASGAVQQQQQQQQGMHLAQQASALVFHHRMTARPEIASRTVGSASGFVLPGEHGSATSVFDTVHLAFDAAGLSGSLCVEEARSKKSSPRRRGGDGEVMMLRVVGGTGAFAFAVGHGALHAVRVQPRGGGAAATALRLELSLSASSAGKNN